MSDSLNVRLADSRAEVTIGERSLSVDRRDDATRSLSCPIELVSAALGS